MAQEGVIPEQDFSILRICCDRGETGRVPEFFRPNSASHLTSSVNPRGGNLPDLAGVQGKEIESRVNHRG